MTHDPDDVLRFWLEDCGPEDWYRQDDALDARIRDRFEVTWQAARRGGIDTWFKNARGSLAFLILTDQFPRNMFRGTPDAFATDELARRIATRAVDRKFDLQIEEPGRQFFYLPFEHSECLADQERAVRLICSRMDAPETLLHARAHRQVIRTFGRFPFRNEALGRTSSEREAAFLADGGYGAVVRELQAGNQGSADTVSAKEDLS
ncbi:DUF924 domain-containing protein [Jannaschia sp. S6380]|uniref:DUF924 family protein n=1 Tax=Jannaschia sp. S6380 TaxID=2926408 RepID=UPI001FF2ADE4|nr:DUF924 family protein [Jannaschia sp. S6380]MCK0167065.1 DUF924 domain-containing protein [Jannaschia sp. S6380]